MIRPIIIMGAGGHATVLADALLAASKTVAGFIERDASSAGKQIGGLKVLGDRSELAAYAPDEIRLVNGLGGTGRSGAALLRESLQRGLEAQGWIFCGVRHPSAIVSPRAQVAESAQVLAAVVIQPGAVIEEGAIINTRSVVEHDCRIGRFVHVAPGAIICGDVILGQRVHVGAGSVIRQGIRVAADVTIGVGAAVITDAEQSGTIAGVPAKYISENP